MDRKTRSKLILITITAVLVLVCMGNVSAATVSITEPNGGESLTGDSTIDFTASTTNYMSSYTADIYIGSSPGSKTNVVMSNLNLITLGGFSPSTGWISDESYNKPTGVFFDEDLGAPPDYVYMQVFYHEGAYRAVGVAGSEETYSFTWNGTQWANDGGLYTAGLIEGGAGVQANQYNDWDVFSIGSELYAVVRTVNVTGAVYDKQGYKYNIVTNQWDTDAGILVGLPACTTQFHGCHFDEFYFDGQYRMIVLDDWRGGGDTAVITSYYWDAAQWNQDGLYIEDYNIFSPTPGAAGEGVTGGADMFVVDSTLYMLQAGWNGTSDVVFGLEWDGSNWIPNGDVNGGLGGATVEDFYYLETSDFAGELVVWEHQTVIDYDVNTYEWADSYYNTTVSTAFLTQFNSANFPNGNYYMTIDIDGAGAGIITETATTTSAAFFTIDNGSGYTPEIPAALGDNVAIYILADDYLTGAVSSVEVTEAWKYGAQMHNWTSYASGSAGTQIGRILIDGASVEPCNYTWDCQKDLNTGSHIYSLYSSIGGYLYSGMFNIDINTNLVRIYVPMTYNLFDVYENQNEEAALECGDIYSLNAAGEAAYSERLGVGLWIDGEVAFWNPINVRPANCYGSDSLPAFYSHALPAYYSGVEPLAIFYSGPNGITGDDADVYGSHLPGSLSGARHKSGELNFYYLHETGAFYQGSGSVIDWRVEQQSPSVEDGTYSPLVSIASPTMNYDSAILGDANYNTGDFGLGDSVTCEASLISHGFSVYDVNILLITDKNAVYDSWLYSPYTRYNTSMPESQGTGAYNTVWHTFENVDNGSSGTIQCAFQTTNELGFKSGWVISSPRTMWASNVSGVSGINIFVKDEDGTIAVIGSYASPQEDDVNYVDIYNFKYEPYFWKYNTSANPLSLFEGDNIITQTRDTNTMMASGKSFNINRGDTFGISLYLADRDASNQAPIATATMLTDSGLTNIKCRTSFYDKDLDWSEAVFKVWNSLEGSIGNPVCTSTQSHALSTNCNPADSPCPIFGAVASINNECASDNDCYVEKYFGKRDCATVTSSGRLTMYCAVELSDLNGNETITQVSTTIEVGDYEVFAICESYANIEGERQSVIFTDQDKGYVECIVGVDNMLTPDSNFTVTLWDEDVLAFQQVEEYESYGQVISIFRSEVTDTLEAYARLYTTDSATWEGTMPIHVSHNVYGTYDTVVPIAVVFQGTRASETTDYTEEQFGFLYDFVDGLAVGMFTDPVGTIQDNFFVFLLIILGIIVLVPLSLASASIAAKGQRSS